VLVEPLVIAFASASRDEDAANFWKEGLDGLADAETDLVTIHIRNRFNKGGNLPRAHPLLEDLSVPAYQWLRSYLHDREEDRKS
jgi:hypothetical protein